jgi:hypothetical protein
MPDLVKYALLLAVDLTIIGVLVHYFLARLHWYTPVLTPPITSDFYNLSSFDQLKRFSYFAVVVVGILIGLHGAFDLLFEWMPPGWGGYNEDDEWVSTASHWSSLCAFFAGVALLGSLEKTAEKVSELQLRQSKSEAFNELLKREVAHLGSMLRHSETSADHFAKVKQEIEQAQRSGAVDFEDARICGDLISIFRLAMKQNNLDRGLL